MNFKYQTADMHVCTEDDWSKFWPPTEADAPLIELKRKRKTMYCIDKLDFDGKPFWPDKLIYGSEGHQRATF